MTPCTRGETPPELAEHGPALAQRYAERRTKDRKFRFQWSPPSLYPAVKAALETMTDRHCSYCDGSPLDATGTDAVDHFRPKGHPSFHHLACEWNNLFLACGRCNHAKREQWDEALLRPDAPDYAFERYFAYRFESGELVPNAAADAADQHRAARTIDILDLNRPGACTSRMRAVARLVRDPDADEAYRFLRSLVPPG